MKILVAGAAGQVGCRLVRQLLERNHEVRGTVLPDDPALERLEGLDIELAAGDLTDEAFVESAVTGVDAVIHTANIVGPQFDNNMQIDRLIARVCGKHADRLERMVYTSSSGVFPNNGETIACAYHPVDERHPKRPMGEYSLGKLIGEAFTKMAARETGLRFSIVRPSHVQSGSAILSRFTVGAVAGLLERGQNAPAGRAVHGRRYGAVARRAGAGGGREPAVQRARFGGTAVGVPAERCAGHRAYAGVRGGGAGRGGRVVQLRGAGAVQFPGGGGDPGREERCGAAGGTDAGAVPV